MPASTRDAPPALVDALLADADVGPRLALAAWLEAQEPAHPRAELIRLQCAEVGGSEARIDELLEAHAEEWVRPLGLAAEECTFRRGFVEEIEVTLRPTTARVEAWSPSAEVPSLRSLVLRGGPPHPVELGVPAVIRRMRWLETLVVDALPMSEDTIAALFLPAESGPSEQGAPFAKLRSLGLSRCGLRGSAIAALGGRATWLGELEHLDLVGNPGLGSAVEEDGPDVLQPLAPLAPRLRSLKLAGAFLSRPSLRTLATLDLRSLRVLDLSTNVHLDADVARELAGEGRFPALETLLADGIFGEARDVLVERFGRRLRP